MIVASVYLFFNTGQKNGEKKEDERHHRFMRNIVEKDGTAFTFSYNPITGVVLSCFIGFLSTFLGIGGGSIHVPVLVNVLNFPVHIATATSHFVLAIMALTGTVVHIATGTFTHGVHRTIALAIGVLLGAQVGALLSNRMKGRWIIQGLAIALGLVGIRLLMMIL